MNLKSLALKVFNPKKYFASSVYNRKQRKFEFVFQDKNLASIVALIAGKKATVKGSKVIIDLTDNKDIDVDTLLSLINSVVTIK